MEYMVCKERVVTTMGLTNRSEARLSSRVMGEVKHESLQQSILHKQLTDISKGIYQ